MGDHSKESLGDHSNESLGDYSMNIHDHPLNVENQPVDEEDPNRECCEEMQGEQELRSQSNHFFFDGTNLCINQTFSNKNELQLLLTKAVANKSFDFSTLRSCTKYLKVKCVSHNYAWMLRARKYEFSNRFLIYKYIGEQSYCVEHANNSHRKFSIKVIVSLCVNMYCDGKGSSVKEIQKDMLILFIVVQAIGNVGREVWLPRKCLRHSGEQIFMLIDFFRCTFFSSKQQNYKL
ncbi:hypothetical protein H5410_002569 [Solanum commersonii]|uniref:Uncharacterized protein n=1 Tax=Solanum commersonii TaxID=4109 RepID=A0A9J6B2H9_SOLCO|nr:hypothetical protein H5410_002569 [Solanum commersonii]